MSIPVTCLECQAHFHVADEFAGLPGRCPECAAVIQVPDPSAAPQEPVDPHPFWTPRGVEAFEEAPIRQREPRPDEGRDAMPPRRAEYAETRQRFDPMARAAKWKAVANGLRNLMVAVSLIAVDLLVAAAFVLVDGVKGAQQGGFGPREKALIIGVGLTAGLCILMWMMGRLGCARVPYVPARVVAMPAGIIAGLTGMTGLIGLTLFVCGFALAQQGNMAGFGLATLGQCALLPAMVGFVIAEMLGVWSQIRMAEGLHEVVFARTSKVMMTVLVLLTSLVVCGFCFIMFLFAIAAEKAAQKQQRQNQQQAPIVQPVEEKGPMPREVTDPKTGKKPIEDRPPIKKDDQQAPPGKKLIDEREPAAKDPAPAKVDRIEPKDKVAEAPPIPQNAPAPAPAPAENKAKPQKQQAEGDAAANPEIVYGITIFSLIIPLIYAGFCLVCFQSGRRAIQSEIRHLMGEPHDPEHQDGRHY